MHSLLVVLELCSSHNHIVGNHMSGLISLCNTASQRIQDLDMEANLK